MTDNAQDETRTLVLGGTGKTGRRVAQRLTARGLSTQVGSRSGQRPFDWREQATWAPVLLGPVRSGVIALPAAEIAGAAGREVRYLPVSPGAVRVRSCRAGRNGRAGDAAGRPVHPRSLDGRNAHLADGVQRALNREPGDFTDYARAAATTGVWGG